MVDTIAARCTEVESGARNVDNILTNTLLPDISRQLLGRIAEGEKMSSIRVSVQGIRQLRQLISFRRRPGSTPGRRVLPNLT